jgi:hypothetical protein
MPYVDGINVQHLLEIIRCCVYTDTKRTMAFDSVRRSVSMTLRVRRVDAYRRGAAASNGTAPYWLCRLDRIERLKGQQQQHHGAMMHDEWTATVTQQHR